MAFGVYLGLLLVVTTVHRSQTSPAPGTPGGVCQTTRCVDPSTTCHFDYCVPFVGLGGPCSINDVCYNQPDPYLKLACVSNKCLIQVGQTCATNTDKCVTGAACNTSSLCACTQGYRNWQPKLGPESNQCRRQAKLGEDCSDGADCVSDDNGPDIKCDPYKFTCAIKAKQACTDSTAQYCTTGSTCQSGNCTCNPPFISDKGACSKTVSDVGGTCGLADTCKDKNVLLSEDTHCDHLAGRCLQAVGQYCNDNHFKCTTGAVCTNDTQICVCSAPYVVSDSGRSCQGPLGTMGGRCNTGNVCSNPQAQCNDDGYCFCKSGYSFRASDSTCVAAPKLNEPCQGAQSCVEDTYGPQLVCDAYRSICVIQESKNCTNMENGCPTGATCTNGVCTCLPGYEDKADACKKIVPTLGEACHPFDKCGEHNSEVPMTCDPMSRTCLIRASWGNCGNHTDRCTTGATCDNMTKTCVCGGLYTQRKYTYYCQAPVSKVGGDCGTGNACSDANAECKDDLCLCKTDFTVELSDASCKKVTNLGSACNPTDTCSHDVIPAASMTCDPLSGRCALKAGAPCEDNPDSCVTGSTCGGKHECSCNDNLVRHSSGSCVPFVGLGGTCSRFDTCHGQAALACVDSTCLIQVGQPCADNPEKCVTGAQCNSSSQCHCSEGYFDYDEDWERICRIPYKLNKPCQGHLTCFDANGPPLVCDGYRSICVIQEGENCTNMENGCPTGATCSNGVCTCLPGYADKSHSCKKLVTTLGEVCGTFDYCRSNNSALRITCDALSSTCLIETSSSCENHTDRCTTGATCDNMTKTCVCGGLYTHSPYAGYCRAPVGKVGGDCSTGNACSDANAECKDDLCLCKTGFTVEPSDASCKKVTNLGSACNPTDTCSDDVIPALSMTCDPLSGRCVIKAHQKCQSHTDQCTTGAKCDVTTKTCLCDGVYTGSSDGSYCEAAQGKAGGECNTGSSCSDSNAECKDGRCVCKTGYKVKASDASCEESEEKSGIGRAAGSVLCLGMAYVFSRLV